MPAGRLVLIVRTPNDRVPAHSVNCLPSWTVYEVKDYISRHFPTHPPPATQRLIHAGKLLKDDASVQTLFKQSSDPQTVHLVCRSTEVPYTPGRLEGMDDVSKIPPSELQQYQQAYYRYLNDFFMQNSHELGSIPSTMVHPMLGYAAFQGNMMTTAPVTEPGSSNAVPNQLSHQPAVQQPVAPAAHQPQQQNNPPVVMIDGGAGMGAGDEFAGEGGNVDIVDRFYILFRLSLFIGLCFAYSSLDKAIIVFSVAAYVYFYNIYRQYVANRQVNTEALRPGIPNAAADNSSDNHLPPGENGDQQSNQRVPLGETNTETNLPAVDVPAAPVQPNRFTSSLRLFASTSFQFVSSLVASLIPEQPPPIAFD